MTAAAAVSKGTKGRVLIVGATGFIGQFVAEASLVSGRPTYVLVSPDAGGNPSCSKTKVIQSLQGKGAIVLHGMANEKETMEKLLKENDIAIVISAVGGERISDQRFLPSEFGHDVVRAEPVQPGLAMYEEKRRVRRVIEESGIPYTYICCNSIASWPYFDNTHPSEVIPPLDQFQIYGDGTVKAYFVAGTDIGKFTMKTVDDPRTLNKSVHFRPSCNCYNMNELAALWEKKIGRVLPRVTVTEDDLLAVAAENSIPKSIVASFTHDIFIKGCQVNFSVDGPGDIEATDLYPDEPFRTLEDCFDDFLAKMKDEGGDATATTGNGNDVVDAKGITASKNPVIEPLAITA